MLMKRFTRRFRRLHWKLTLSYTLTSVVAILLIEVTLLGILTWYISTNSPSLIANNLKQQAPQVSSYIASNIPDRSALTTQLRIINVSITSQGTFHYNSIFLTAVDMQGLTIASAGTHPFSPGASIQAALSPQNWINLHKVLGDFRGTTTLSNNIGMRKKWNSGK